MKYNANIKLETVRLCTLKIHPRKSIEISCRDLEISLNNILEGMYLSEKCQTEYEIINVETKVIQEEQPKKPKQVYKCICCAKVLTSLSDCEYPPEEDIWDNAGIHTFITGFGSKHDCIEGNQFIVGICDECITEKLEERLIIRKDLNEKCLKTDSASKTSQPILTDEPENIRNDVENEDRGGYANIKQIKKLEDLPDDLLDIIPLYPVRL